jgi:hypothetical protein
MLALSWVHLSPWAGDVGRVTASRDPSSGPGDIKPEKEISA